MTTQLPLRIPWRALGRITCPSSSAGSSPGTTYLTRQLCRTQVHAERRRGLGMGMGSARSIRRRELSSSTIITGESGESGKIDASAEGTKGESESISADVKTEGGNEAKVKGAQKDATSTTESSKESAPSASAASPSSSTTQTTPPPPKVEEEDSSPRRPRAEQAAYLAPMRRVSTYDVPTASLQMRGYNLRNLEFMADFALRAAYYLDLPASGPVPLPRLVKRWTVPRGHFIHKKKQENYERITYRRLIQIKDGSAESVELWLAFLRKHAYYGIGMKANVWEFAGLNVSADMDAQMERMRKDIEPVLGQFAFKEGSKMADGIIERVVEENRRMSSGWAAPMVVTPLLKRPVNVNETRK